MGLDGVGSCLPAYSLFEIAGVLVVIKISLGMPHVLHNFLVTRVSIHRLFYYEVSLGRVAAAAT